MSDNQPLVLEYVAPTIENYDPNMTLSGRMAKQQVELVFQHWDYTGKFTAEVGGNCTGLAVIDSAIDNIYARLPDHPLDSSMPVLYLRNSQGETMEVEDEEELGEDWLKDMLVSARILSIEPDGML